MPTIGVYNCVYYRLGRAGGEPVLASDRPPMPTIGEEDNVDDPGAVAAEDFNYRVDDMADGELPTDGESDNMEINISLKKTPMESVCSTFFYFSRM